MFKKTLAILLLATTVSAGDFGSGNGGDTVTCENSEVYDGTYFLDYLDAIMRYPDAEYYESFERVLTALKEKVPTLGVELEAIKKAYDDEMRDGKYVWSDLSPTELADENLSYKLPEGCEMKPTQLVLRNSPNEYRSYYHAERERVDNLGSQQSWMFLHEVLWSFYDDAFDVRAVNELIHNKRYADYSSKDFIDEIKKAASPVHFVDWDEYQLLISLEDAYKEFVDENRFDVEKMKKERRNKLHGLLIKDGPLPIGHLKSTDVGLRAKRLIDFTYQIRFDFLDYYSAQGDHKRFHEIDESRNPENYKAN